MQRFLVTVLVLGLIPAILAQKCGVDKKCNSNENCRCWDAPRAIPSLADIPQLVTITFDEAISTRSFAEVYVPLLFNRTNPDGKSISGTFYVPHEYTDYVVVQQLYSEGFEIGINSISRNPLVSYWKNASQKTLNEEFDGQRKIISHFANISLSEVSGARTPLLQLNGDLTINAYRNAGITYDNSWPTLTSAELYPYTLDYASGQKCDQAIRCPVASHAGFWILPISNLRAYGTSPNNPTQCNALVNCNIDDDVSAQQISDWLTGELNRIRTTTKTPITLMVNSGWFDFAMHAKDGLTLFLNGLSQYKDVFLVSHKQVLDWTKNPVPLKDFKTTSSQRSTSCTPNNCNLSRMEGKREIKYVFRSCTQCPWSYPWLGNPLGLPPTGL